MARQKQKRVTRQKRAEGAILEIPLGDDSCAYARVLKEPLIAFYNYKGVLGSPPPLLDIVAKPIAFKIWVMNSAVTSGLWRIIGNVPLESALRAKPWFYKQDSISGRLYKLRTGNEEIPATREECVGLEAAAVWSHSHVIDRLRDTFAGRANQWVESMRPK